MVMLVNPLQLLNASWHIDVTELGKLTFFKPTQLWKAHSPIHFTELGISMFTSDLLL